MDVWHWINAPTVVGLVFFVAAAIAWRNVWFAYASRGWPTTPARLDYLGLSRLKRADEYRLLARYTYTVNGVDYESSRWRFGAAPSGNMAAVTLAASTEIKPVDPVVFYDPTEPGRSCLVAGLHETALLIPLVASVMGVFAFMAGHLR